MLQNKTAVEFLIEFCLNDLPIEQWNKYNGLFEQAKEMEKQQIIDAFELWRTGSGEQYYNETYGSKGSDEHHEDNLEEIPTSSQTEISDEEIEEASLNIEHYNLDMIVMERIMWRKGAKWYREQLKKKQ